MADTRVSGWGVIRVHPWQLAGVFPTQAKAVERMDKLTPGFVVRFGEGSLRTGEFYWDRTDD